MTMTQLAIRMNRIVAPLCLLSGPIFIGLGVWKSNPEWAVGGAMLMVLAVVLNKRSPVENPA